MKKGKVEPMSVQLRKTRRTSAEPILSGGRRLEKWGQQAWEGRVGEGAYSIVETVSCGTGGTTSLSIGC